MTLNSTFGNDYWEERWQSGHDDNVVAMSTAPPNPHLVAEVSELPPGTALDAGCGAGAEAIWLADAGWQVTAVDVSAAALARADERWKAAGGEAQINWVQADLTTWTPDAQYDLVTTHYAHSSIPQLDLYERLSTWVKPGGSLLIVGHLHQHGAKNSGGHNSEPDHAHGHGHDHATSPNAHHDPDVQHSQHEQNVHHEQGPPEEATSTLDEIVARLGAASWQVVRAHELTRTVAGPGGQQMHDVVVHARRQ